jgi:hypothetical protein
VRRLLLAAALLLGAGTAAGCETTSQPPPPARAASPQRADVAWVEPTAEQGPRLVFEVDRVEVTEDGWRAAIAIENQSGVAWDVGRTPEAAALDFGVMLFATGELDELERRNRDRAMPGLRRAQLITPQPPPVLDVGDRWEGTIEATGALAADRWLRVSFGPLFARDTPPEGLPRDLLWISDNALRLQP